MGPPIDYPEANAVIIFDNAEMEVNTNFRGYYVETVYHVRMKVLTPAGVDEVGDREFEYRKSDKLKDFKAHTVLPGGKKYKVEKDAIFEKETGSFKVQTFSFPNVVPGCIVEYTYKVKSKSAYFLKPWYFQNEIYTVKSQFSVSLWPGYSYDVSYNSVPRDRQNPAVEEHPDPERNGPIRMIKTFTWTLENLYPIKDEPYMSCENDYRSSIRFQIISYTNPYGGKTYYVKNWRDVAVEDAKFLDEYCNQNNEVRELAERLTTGLTTDEEKSRALFSYVRDSIKTTDGTGVWFEHDNMKKMFETGFETREGKNQLLCELHRAVGIKSWPVMVSTRSKGKFDPKFVSDQQFNTQVTFVQLGQTWQFLDAASTYIPYGILSPDCLTDGGLLVDFENPDLVRITIQPTGSYRTDMSRVYIDTTGAVTCSTNSEFGGYYAAEYSTRFDEKTPEEFIETYYSDRLDCSHTLGDSRCHLDDSNHFVVNLDFTSDDMVRMLDNNVQISPVKFAFRDNPFESETRVFPVDFIYPFVYHNQNEFFFASEPGEVVFPENIDKYIEGASFHRQSVMTDSSLIVITQLKITTPEFAPFKYSQVRGFFEEYAAMTGDKITVVLPDAE